MPVPKKIPRAIITAHDRLVTLDETFQIFHPGQKIVILGCTDGFWILYAAVRLMEVGQIIGVDSDLSTIEKFAEHVELEKADILDGDQAALTRFKKAHGQLANGVLSELLPKRSRNREENQARSLEQVKAAWSWTKELLVEGGFFLFKALQSEAVDNFIGDLSKKFNQITRINTQPSKTGQEICILLRGFRLKS
ncbi:MAG: hypothetical protein LBR11_02675 [Deltaproteobacteria bacterium]|jgi:23S rRNA U2552 (ribose-2'-O)-methylase RlmE/FtsJ|nr:hypothetical protein [Deltaproteobacteria bacterium]